MNSLPSGPTDAGRLGRWSSMWLATIAWGTVLPYTATGLGIATLGWAVMMLGLWIGARAALTAGTVILLGGPLISASQGAPAAMVAIGIAAAIVAWDVGETAIGLSIQLGQAADTVRAEVPRIVVGLAIGGTVASLAVIGPAIVSHQLPVLSVVFLLFGACCIAIALDTHHVLTIDYFRDD